MYTPFKTTEPLSGTYPGYRSERRLFWLICLVTCVPVYWASLFYIEVVTHQEIEELAIAVTIGFFLFFYLGWSLTALWINAGNKPLQGLVKLLIGLVLTCTIWLFAHADLQLNSLPGINLLLYWMPFLFLSVSIGALVNLVRRMVITQLQQAHINAEQSRSELSLLQSQLSPHFLFNTLNNLYGLSLTRHEEIPKLLLKLSDLLRYAVYDARELLVPLQDEIAYINNYIDFEKIRIGDRLSLTTAIEPVADRAIKIAPMLLIVFIENAFKHSKNTADEKIFVDIAIKNWHSQIWFAVRNSCRPLRPGQDVPAAPGGLGLTNVRKRLQLLYPDTHQLRIDETASFFEVTLQLSVK